MFFKNINNRISVLLATIDRHAGMIHDLENDKELFKQEIRESIKAIEQNINALTSIESVDSVSPTIMSLLKKIAKLEGVKDAIEHRKTSEEVLERYKQLNNLKLKLEREEKDVNMVNSQLEILKWVLGE